MPELPQREYEAKFTQNIYYSGAGLDTAMHSPCPWCAEPNFQVVHPFAGLLPGDTRPSLHEEMAQVATCKHCGRSGYWVINRDAGGVVAEFVQAGGPPGPSYLPPMRRA